MAKKKTKDPYRQRAEPAAVDDDVLGAADQHAIQQMIPAEPGWCAVWFDTKRSRGRFVLAPETLITEPISMWALYDDGNPERRVGGLVAGIGGLTHPELNDNFRGYIPSPDNDVQFARMYCKELNDELGPSDDDEDDEDEDD